MTPYGRQWKARTLRACNLYGVQRIVLHTLITFGDWKGRSRRPYREIAVLAGISPRSCFDALHFLASKGFILELEAGQGRRPTMFQVVDCQIPEPVVVQSDCTKTKSVVVQFQTPVTEKTSANS